MLLHFRPFSLEFLIFTMISQTNPKYLSPFASRITGTGSAFPETIVTNDDVVQGRTQLWSNAPQPIVLETHPEWIQERTGIRERRLSRPGVESETNSSLGARASMAALEMAGKTPEQVDIILYATCSPDTLLPSTACWLQKKIGAKNAWAMDLNAACSGFVYGISIADQYIRTGQAKTILVVGSEVMNPLVNWTDRNVCILFGDGAGAAVIEATSSTDEHRVLSTHMRSDGNLWDYFHILAGGSKMETTPEVFAQNLHKSQMKGKEIFKVAVKTLADFALEAAHANGFDIQEIDWIVPHQANLRILEAVAKRLNYPIEKVIVNIDRFGNTSAATVPTAFDEAVRDGRIQPGHLVLMDVFGAGLTYGSALIRY